MRLSTWLAASSRRSLHRSRDEWDGLPGRKLRLRHRERELESGEGERESEREREAEEYKERESVSMLLLVVAGLRLFYLPFTSPYSL